MLRRWTRYTRRPDCFIFVAATVAHLKCLAQKPADRFPDAMNMALALTASECAGKRSPEQAAQWWDHRAAAMR